MNRPPRRNYRDTTTVETERSRGVDCENWKLGWPAPVHLPDDSFLCPARDRAGSHRKSKSHEFCTDPYYFCHSHCCCSSRRCAMLHHSTRCAFAHYSLGI